MPAMFCTALVWPAVLISVHVIGAARFGVDCRMVAESVHDKVRVEPETELLSVGCAELAGGKMLKAMIPLLPSRAYNVLPAWIIWPMKFAFARSLFGKLYFAMGN